MQGVGGVMEKYGLFEGINEVIGITAGDWLNTAPLGIIVGDDIKVRLYSNHTKSFLERSGELFVNVIHDPVVFVISAFEDLDEGWFESLDPPVIRNAMSWIRFEAEIEGNFAHLKFIEGGVIRKGVRAVNRGFNAVIEAAVHGTRYVFSRNPELRERILYYGRIVERCGGKRERKAFDLLLSYTGIQI